MLTFSVLLLLWFFSHLARTQLSLRIRATLPSGWVDMGALTGDEPLVLTLALRLRNTDALHKTLRAVSQPSSPDYGRYLSAQEANALVAPAPESLSAVVGVLLCRVSLVAVARLSL